MLLVILRPSLTESFSEAVSLWKLPKEILDYHLEVG